MGQMFRRLLELHGLDALGIARQAGVDLAAIPAPGERIEVDKIDAILRVASPLAGDPAFGLQAARCWHPSELGVLGYAWLSSSTLRTGLERAARYSRLVGERGVTELEDTRQGLKVRFWAKRGNPAVVPVAAVFVDIVMAILFDLCRMNAGAALRPVAATLRRRKPDPATPTSALRLPGQFGVEENTFVISAKDADRRPVGQPSARGDVRQDAYRGDARLHKSRRRLPARAAVLDHLSSGEGTAEDAAGAPHEPARCSASSPKPNYLLQLVDDTRKDLALRYIEDRAARSPTSPSRLILPAERVHSRVQRWTGSVKRLSDKVPPPPSTKRFPEDGAPGLAPGASGQVASFRSVDSSSQAALCKRHSSAAQTTHHHVEEIKWNTDCSVSPIATCRRVHRLAVAYRRLGAHCTNANPRAIVIEICSSRSSLAIALPTEAAWRVMKFNVQHLDAEQDVELSWLSGITNAAELLRIATLEVGESITLQCGSARLRASAPVHVKRVS